MLSRRDLIKLTLLLGRVLSSRVSMASALDPSASDAAGAAAAASSQPGAGTTSADPFEPEYIVVGSGAGGGTVAARLAEEGYRVLLLEAGGDAKTMVGPDAQSPTANAMPHDYDVPAFHALSTENEAMKWDFFVRHYADDGQQRKDRKFVETWNGERVDGIWYPRAGTLGGCTSHNAMIFVYPHDSDWNQLADRTGDPSWRAENMRKYGARLENCQHRPLARLLSKVGIDPTGHGWNGWLATERALPPEAIFDRDLRTVLIESSAAGRDALEKRAPGTHVELGLKDPNDLHENLESAIGLRYPPLTTNRHARVGARERLLDVQRRRPGFLRIEMHALVTRVLFDETRRAVGVEYLKGERLYRAHARPSQAAGEVRQARASREVILSGGTFNTPQLLMLSGIGPREVLNTYNIPIRMELPGVGKNLQDRYEVAVVYRMKFDAWESLRGATYTSGDAQYRQWASERNGVYATNGALMSVIATSTPGKPDPDLFFYALIGSFIGYYPTYSTEFAKKPNAFSWVVLKAHTNNTAGEVTLASADARDRPRINFRYFQEGSDASGDDLRAVVEGVKLARTMAAPMKARGFIAKEDSPGDDVQTDEQLTAFVRDNAWGHHASCTCPIGGLEEGGVLSTDFKVHGTTGLRVVDASVFPRIPGFFIVSAVYMIGEKAADLLIADARRNEPPRRA